MPTPTEVADALYIVLEKATTKDEARTEQAANNMVRGPRGQGGLCRRGRERGRGRETGAEQKTERVFMYRKGERKGNQRK